MELWNCGIVELWNCGIVEMLKCINVEMLKCGNVELGNWRIGELCNCASTSNVVRCNL